MNVLIVTYYRYPDGDAGAVRQHSFAKMYQKLGYDVTVIGMGDFTNFIKKEYNGIKYVSFRNVEGNNLRRINNYLGYKKRLIRFLDSEKRKFDIIQVINIPINSLLWLKKYSNKNKAILIHDSVEWYSSNQFHMRGLSPAYISKELYNRLLIDKSFNVIAISKYLERHFNDREINTIRIPVILDAKNITFNKKTNERKIIIVYAGSPGNKDYLKDIIYGLNLLHQTELEKIELRIIGVTKEQIVNNMNVDSQIIDKLNNNIKILGRMSRQSVLENLEEADFTVLLRPSDQRYAKAGFPTKVVESLLTGTPVICNITSDLGDYIYDGENGIIVEECDPHSFSKALAKACKLTFDERLNMQKNARIRGSETFDYTSYLDKLRVFVNNIKK